MPKWAIFVLPFLFFTVLAGYQRAKLRNAHLCLCQVQMLPGLDKKETVGDLNCGRHQIAFNSNMLLLYLLA